MISALATCNNWRVQIIEKSNCCSHILTRRLKLSERFVATSSFFVKGKVFPYSLTSVGPGADPGVRAVSPQVTWSESRHRPGSRLPLLSARPTVTFVAFTRWRYLWTAAHIWFQLTTQFIDPGKMKGWVGRVGWSVADGLPTLVVTHQLQVERRTGKVSRPETDHCATPPTRM